MHGYELKNRLEHWRMDLWAGVQPGSIYAMFGRLEAEGLIEKAPAAQSGRRPVRQPYRITKAGRAELRRLLREQWASAGRTARPVDVAASFFRALPVAEIADLLRNRIATLTKQIEEFETADRHEQEPLDASVDRMVHDLIAHELLLLRAERSWTVTMASRFEAGGYDE
jgi:DNA-binding PadR family transcriptional regulator